ncbi:MAG: hypothetical protein JXR77_14710 [Lentisphaeria bacterium]|nr:hypothetical protein [Lentisphaeria bacterium]
MVHRHGKAGVGAVAVLVLTAMLWAHTVAGRTWTDVSGNRMEAEFVDFRNGIVRIKRQDNKVLAIPWDRLSKQDQRYVTLITTTRKHSTGLPYKLGAGVICGLPSLLISKRKKNLGVGLLAFTSCCVGGFFMGFIVALPVGLLFLVLVGTLPD